MVIAVTGDRQVTLSWEPSPGATHYVVRRRTSESSGDYTDIATGVTGTSFLNTGLTNGTRYYYVVAAVDGSGTGADSQQARGVPYKRPASGAVRWPLANSTANDSDPLRYAFGPRYIGRYDFHAGIDINAPNGTPVYALMAGVVVAKNVWNGTSTGAGNNVRISHGDQLWTGYLHLHDFAPGLELGSWLEAGDLVGYVGRTGASTNHLHLTVFVGLTGTASDERRSVTPLELLPYSGRPNVTASFRATGNTVDLYLPTQQNTIRWIMLQGQGQSRMVDYYDIVAQGSTPRDTQSQYGILLNTAAPAQGWPAPGGTVHLWVRPDPADAFEVERIVVKDYEGVTLVDEVRVLAPPAPTGLAASAVTDTSLTLGWIPQGVVDSFRVERSPTGIGSWSQRGTSPGTEPSWAEQGLLPATRYHYRVSATNAGGMSPYSSVLEVSTLSAYAAWRGFHLIDPDATDASDHDGNGIPLLAEYALGVTPGDPAGAGLPVLVLGNDELRLTYRRLRQDVAYVVESSTDGLANWSAAEVVQEAEVIGDLVTASAPFGLSGRRFLRLALQRLP